MLETYYRSLDLNATSMVLNSSHPRYGKRTGWRWLLFRDRELLTLVYLYIIDIRQNTFLRNNPRNPINY